MDLIPSKKQIDEILKQDVKTIPVFPVAALKLLELTRDKNTDASDLAKVVETDPGIAARVLSITNSAAYALIHKVGSVSQAIVLLGFETIRNIAIGLTVFDRMVKDESGFNRLHYWRHCIAVAGMSMAIAKSTGDIDPETAYLAGLMHDIGKTIIDMNGKIGYGDLVDTSKESGKDVYEEEVEVIGMGHDTIGAYFCNKWNMPDIVTRSVGLHHQPLDRSSLPEDIPDEEADDALKLAAIVAFADFLAWTQGIGSFDIASQPTLQPQVEDRIDIDSLDIGVLAKKMDTEVSATAEFYKFELPDPDKFRESLLRANLELGRINSKFLTGVKPEESIDDSIWKYRDSLTKPLKIVELKKIVPETLDAIHSDFGFDRLYVLKSTGRTLKHYESHDTTNLGLDLSGLSIDLDQETNGFIECMRSHRPVIIKGNTMEETAILDFLRVSEIGIVPISGRGRTMGLLCVDNAFSEKPVTIKELSIVSMIASEMGIALENAAAMEKMRLKANIDGLTKVNNRANLDEELIENFERAAQGSADLSIAMIDIDYFKSFNDRFGHLAGDNVLRLTAGSLKKSSRPTDIVGRYGGEEFMVILIDTNYEKAILFGERIRSKIEKLGGVLKKRYPGRPLTISVGIASYAQGMPNREELIGIADKALYTAKETGRNKVCGAGDLSKAKK